MKALFGSAAAGMIIIILGILVVALCITVFSLAMNVNRLNRKYRAKLRERMGERGAAMMLAILFMNTMAPIIDHCVVSAHTNRRIKAKA